MSDFGKWVGDGLKALVATPVSLFLAAFIVGLLVLYARPVPGLGLEVVRARAGPWIGVITLASGVLFVVRTLAFIAYNGTKLVLAWLNNRAPKGPPPLVFTTNAHMGSATCGQSKQLDNSVVTQILLDFFVHNHTREAMYLRAARLITPRVRLEDTLPGILTLSDPYGGRTHSSNHPILGGGQAEGRVVLMVKRPLGRPGKLLRAVIGLTDQTGHEYRLKERLRPRPTASPTVQPQPNP